MPQAISGDDGNRVDPPLATELTRLPTKLAPAIFERNEAKSAADSTRLRGKARWMMITAWVVSPLV